MAKKICSCGKIINVNDECSCQKAKRAIQNKDKAKRNAEEIKFLQSRKWRKIRLEIIKRDGGYCQRCFILYQRIESKMLEAHHIKSRLNYPELRLDKDNLICLCKQCNNSLGTKDKLDFQWAPPNESDFVL